MQKERVSVFSLFALLFISRLMTALVYIPNGSGMSGSLDEILFIFIGFIINIFLFLPVLKLSDGGCIINGFGKTAKRPLGMFYFVILIFFSAQAAGSFDRFATQSLSARTEQVFFSILLAAAACYAAVLGIAGLARAACVVSLVTVISLTALAIALWDKYDILAVRPLFTHGAGDYFSSFLSSSVLMPEAVALYAVYGCAKKPLKKGFWIFLPVAFIAVAGVSFINSAVFGAASADIPYALYKCATVADFGSISRLDPLIVSLWIGGAYIKSALFLTSAVVCLENAFGKINRTAAAVTGAVITALVGSVLSESRSLISSPVLLLIEQVFTLAGAFIIPVILLITSKKNRRVGREA